MSGKRSRDKGKRGERDVARILSEVLGEDCHRGWQARDGADAPDVVGVDGFWIEVKFGARPNIGKAWEQAKEDSFVQGEHITPVAVTKQDRKEWLATMSLRDFASLLVIARAAKSMASDIGAARAVLLGASERAIEAAGGDTRPS